MGERAHTGLPSHCALPSLIRKPPRYLAVCWHKPRTVLFSRRAALRQHTFHALRKRALKQISSAA